MLEELHGVVSVSEDLRLRPLTGQAHGALDLLTERGTYMRIGATYEMGTISCLDAGDGVRTRLVPE